MQTQASFGWMGPDPIDILVTNRTTASVAVGDVVLLDVRRSDVDSTNNQVGSANAGLANIVVQIALAFDIQAAGIFAVCQQAGGDNTKVVVRLKGQCDAVRCNAAVVLANARGVPLGGGAANALRIVSAATETTGAAAALATKVIFQPLTAIGVAGTTDGWFNGVEGQGTILLT